MTPAQFWAQTVLLRWCDAVVCNSKAAADRLATAGLSREKLSVIGNALPIEMFEPCPTLLFLVVPGPLGSLWFRA